MSSTDQGGGKRRTGIKKATAPRNLRGHGGHVASTKMPGRDPPQFQHQRAGYEGQVSIPEQNEIVWELAGPSQHLLPATSKISSGNSSLNTSSS